MYYFEKDSNFYVFLNIFKFFYDLNKLYGFFILFYKEIYLYIKKYIVLLKNYD